MLWSWLSSLFCGPEGTGASSKRRGASPVPGRREAATETMSAEAEWWFSPLEGRERHLSGSKWADCPPACGGAVGGPLLCAFMGTFSYGVQP